MATERIVVSVSERGARTVSRKIGQIGTSATAAGGAVKLLRRALGLLGGALILGNVIRTLANFSQAMSTVKAITGATQEQFKELRDEAKRLGATTRFSATQAAEGMQFLARAGFAANEVMASIGDTLNLAQAGALELGRAADIASNVLKGFNLTADETTRIVDVLVKTSNSANTNVEQLGQAMSFVAPAAAAVGVEVELAAAAIGALSDAGVQATRAGTSLRQIFVKFLDPTKKARGVIDGLGISTKDLNITTRGLIPVLKTLAGTNLTLEKAAALVGVRQAANLLILTKSIPSIERLNKANKESAGTAALVAKIMDENLNGALFAVKSAVEAVIIAFGDLGAEGLLTRGFRGLASILRLAATNIDKVVDSLGILAVAFVALKLPAIIGLFQRLALALLLNPVVAFGAALTAIAVTLTLLRDEIKLTEDGTVLLGDAFTSFSDSIGTTLVNAVNTLGGSFDNIDGLFTEFLENFGRGITIMLAAVAGAAKAIVNAFKDFPASLKIVAVAAWNGFLSIMDTSLNFFVKAVNSALSFVGLEASQFELFDTPKLTTDAKLTGKGVAESFKEGFNEVIRGSIEQGALRTARLRAGVGSESEPLAQDQAALTGAKKGIVKEGETAFAKLLKNLRTEGELLQLTNEKRQIRETLIAAELELKRPLTSIEKQLVEITVANNIELEKEFDLLEQLRGPTENYADNLKTLNRLLNKGKISQAEFNSKIRDLRIAMLETSTTVGAGFERGFLKAQRDIEDFASTSEKLITDAFSNAQDAVVDFFKTGEFSADAFFKNLANNFLKLGTQQLFAAGFGQGSKGGGFLQNLLGGGGGGGLGGFVSGLLGFASGVVDAPVNSLAVSNLGGVDNRLVAFRARSDETVSVQKRGQRGGGGVTIQFNITTPNADSFKRSQGQLMAQASAVLSRANKRDN